MPELPEVESARSVIARAALNRRIAEVDDRDSYVSRPHQPGEIGQALVGRKITEVHRRGKLMWCETSGAGRSKQPGPTFALHLGMAGRIIITSKAGERDEGGDYAGRAAKKPTHKPQWDRFTIKFTDGGSLRLYDKRRLGRVYLNPEVDVLGPDAGEVGVQAFRDLIGRSQAPVKARLLDQHAIAGVGNLLADELLWQAAIDPRRPAADLTVEERNHLHRQLRKAIRAALRNGGVHTGEVIKYRKVGSLCPRCGAPMTRARVGGRTTWFCSQEQ